MFGLCIESVKGLDFSEEENMFIFALSSQAAITYVVCYEID